jgi:hypothetical protein
MRSCKHYVFKLTSGQLEQAGLLERLGAAVHRLLCRPCAEFTRNDRSLDELLNRYRQHIHGDDDHGSGPR